MRWLVFLLALAVAPAQTFVVDAANGPGTHFTDLATAVAAVPDGAVLQVRNGGYPSFAITGKSLTIVGEGNPHLAGATGASVTIQALAAGQRVVIRNLSAVTLGGVRTTFTCQNCAGEIVLDHVAGFSFFESQLVVSQCAQVVITGSAFGCNPAAATLTGSDVTLVDCTLTSGHNAVPFATLLQQPALVQTGGRVQLTNCLVTAGGNLFLPTPPAVSMQGGVLRADGGTWLRSDFGFVPGLAIAGTGTARLDPSVAMFAAQPPVAPSIIATTLALPSLRVTGGAVGTTTDATLVGASGRLGVSWIGLPGPAVALPWSGDPLAVWNGVILAVGVLGTPLLASVNIPNQSAFFGAAFGWQGLALDANGSFELTNAVPFVLY